MYPFQTVSKAIDNTSQSNSVLDNQWPNQSVYQNVDLETVDWAALAQQWIHMKETCPNDEPALEAPPPPNISRPDVRDLEEQGEAPMEVVRDDDVMENETNYSTFPIQNTAVSLQPPNWNSSLPDPQNLREWQKKNPGWNTWTNPNVPNQSKLLRLPLLNDPFTTSTPVYSIKQDSFWSANSNSSLETGNSFDQSPQLIDTNKSGTPLVNIDITPSPLDAAQRKTLPAWIREGLEKMEKEKQKDADRAREARQREERLRQEKLKNELKMNQAPGTFDSEPPAYHVKSKFESESDDSDSGGDQLNSNKDQMNKKPSPSKSPPITLKPHRTKSEILEDIMLMVRTNLTEILLEVTNEEIKAIANETLSKTRSRGRKAQTVQKNALSGIGLGLVTYDDSDGDRSSSDSEEEKEDDSSKADNLDSETELREIIECRKQAFEAKSEEIEAFLAEKDNKERHWLEEDNKIPTNDSKTGNNDDVGKNINEMESGEVQQENNKFSSTSGRKQHERKGSRFSDAKHLLYSVPATVQLNSATSMYGRLNSTESKSQKKEMEKTTRDDNERDSDTSSKSSKASRNRHSNSHRRDRHDDNKYRKKSRRHSSSSSERSYSSRQSKSSHRHSTHGSSHRNKDRSRSRDRSHHSRSSSRSKRDKSYSRTHSYRKSRSRSRSRDNRSNNKHKHR